MLSMVASCEKSPQGTADSIIKCYSIQEFKNEIMLSKQKKEYKSEIDWYRNYLRQLDSIYWPNTVPNGYALYHIQIGSFGYGYDIRFRPATDMNSRGELIVPKGDYVDFKISQFFGYCETNGKTIFDSYKEQYGVEPTKDGVLFVDLEYAKRIILKLDDDTAYILESNLDLTYEELLSISQPMEIPVN